MSSKTRTESHFSVIPQADIQRSSFDRSCGTKTTIRAGDVTPVMIDEILPGDTISLTPEFFGRLATPIVPIMDNGYIDYHVFFCPTRLVWENWERFNGAQDNPDDTTSFTIPQTSAPAVTGYLNMTLQDHFGLPTLVPSYSHNALPLRGYNKIWNEWYRDENLQNSVTVPMGDGPDPSTDFLLCPRGKRKDYFAGGLPAPQKGPAVNLPLGTEAPVLGIGKGTNVWNNTPKTGLYESGQTTTTTYQSSQYIDPSNADRSFWVEQDGTTGFPNIRADLTDATAATINQLRLAFQVQKMYERDMRGGTRYIEILKAHFNVTSPDFRLQRPEFLGGGTQLLNVTPVPQTSSTDAETPQGNLAAYATFSSGGKNIQHSFTEHGYLYVFVSFRTDLNYQQGLNRLWSRQTRFDFYWPALSHLGEQAVLLKEIYTQSDSANNPDGDPWNETVFCYQERFAEYRYKPNEIHSLFRSNAGADSLDIWHFAQDFGSIPAFNSGFIVENPPIERVLAIETDAQILLDCHFKYIHTRPMPTYSVPGLVDHF